MRISDWSSDVCSSDLPAAGGADLRRLASDADRARARARFADRAGPAGLLRRRRRPRRAVNAAAADSDRLTRFLLDRAGVRGVRVHLGDSWTQLRVRDDYPLDRKSVVEGKSVSVRVDHVARVMLKKKKEKNTTKN